MEARRPLESVSDLDLLRSLAALAARLTGQPLAWITLVDRAPIVVHFGDFPEPDVAACTSVALCVESPEIVDPRVDVRWRDHPFVRGEPRVKTVACAPIRTLQGALSGAIAVGGSACVREEDLVHLQTLASQVAVHVAQCRLRSEVQALRARFEEILDHFPAAILLEEDELCAHVSEGLAQMFAIDAPLQRLSLRAFQRMHRRDAMALVAEFTTDPSVTRRRLEEVATRESGCVGERLVLVDGRHLSIDCVPLRASDAHERLRPNQARIWVFRDVTEAAREESELRASLSALRDANAAKLRFLGVLGHEMRTPLSSMLGSIDLAATARADEARLALERAKRGGRGLLRFTEDILDYARTESGALRLSPRTTDLRLVIDESLSTAVDAARATRVKVTKSIADDVPSTVLVDSERLTQVLVNLLSNAMKFAPTGNVSLTVRVVEARAHAPRVEFRIQDDGPGVDPADHERIFAPFEQLSAGRKAGGSGLGLTVCRSLVTQMHGSLTLESAGGMGAAFIVTLPLPVSSAKTSSRTTRPPHLFLGVRVLVIDDDEDNRYVLSRYLERAGCIVESTDDPEVAIARAVDPALYAIVTDNTMPVTDGPTLTRRIRANERASGKEGRHIRIVGVTADADEATREHCLASGMDAWLLKPVNVMALLESVMGDELVERAQPAAQVPAAIVDPHVLARVARYLERRANDVDDARVALMVEDIAGLARIGHNLRGSGASFGFPLLSELGGQLEDLAKRSQLALMPPLLDRLDQEVARERSQPNRQTKR